MKIRFLFLTITLFSAAGFTHAQYEYDSIPEPEVKVYAYDSVEVTPNFLGSDGALDRYVDNKLSFSDRAYKFAKSGTVIIGFVVEKDGDLSEIRCLHRRRVGYGVEEACMELFENMPAWNPGTIDGDPVRVRYSKSIVLSL